MGPHVLECVSTCVYSAVKRYAGTCISCGSVRASVTQQVSAAMLGSHVWVGGGGLGGLRFTIHATSGHWSEALNRESPCSIIDTLFFIG